MKEIVIEGGKMNPNLMNTNTAEVEETSERTAEQIFDEIMEDLKALEKALEKDPTNVKLQRYAELNRSIAEKLLAVAGGDEEEIRVAEKKLGAAARVVSGAEITSEEFAQSGEKARRYDRDGMLLMEDEKPSAATYMEGEQNQ